MLNPGSNIFRGIRVVDFTRVMSGPFCTAMLADLGAEVIKVEDPDGGDISRHVLPNVGGVSAYFAYLNRNKKSIALDLKVIEARQAVLELIATADVVVENFRPGVADRLGIGWRDVARVNPSAIYASISGFGQSGKFAGHPAYDLIVQAMSGLMDATGFADGPPTAVGESIVDACVGVFAAWGIAAALYNRERTGRGEQVDVAMMDSILTMMATKLSRELNTDQPLLRQGNRHPATCPVDSFSASDGDFVIVCFGDAAFRRLAASIGKPELTAHPDFATNEERLENEPRLQEILGDWAGNLTVSEALETLQAANIPCGPVWSLRELIGTGYLDRCGLVKTMPLPSGGSIRIARQPVRFGQAGAAASRNGDNDAVGVPVALGASTGDILAGVLEYSREDIARLNDAGAFGRIAVPVDGIARSEATAPFERKDGQREAEFLELLLPGADIGVICDRASMAIARKAAISAAAYNLSVAVACISASGSLPHQEIESFCRSFQGRVLALRNDPDATGRAAELIASLAERGMFGPRRVAARLPKIMDEIQRIGRQLHVKPVKIEAGSQDG